MARLRRLVLPEEPHLIIQRSHSGRPAILDADDRSLYLAALRASAREALVDIHAYGLQPSEVRLLVTPKHAGGLAGLMQSLGRRYVRAFNQKYGHTGSPWEGRFRSTPIEAARYFLPAMRFVEAMPAEPDAAGLSLSSREHHLGVRNDPLISSHPALWALGNTPFEREVAYRRFVDTGAPADEMAGILRAALNGWALGSPAFAAGIHAQTGRRAHPAAPGRPRKRPPDAGV